MNSKTINIDAKEIADWDSFHLLFRTALGFPEWYGSNQDAGSIAWGTFVTRPAG